jgi:dolichol-phosphate mannosyltransferase
VPAYVPAASPISVVVPTLNERENIAGLLEAISEALAMVDFEVIVVDDASTDGTAAAVSEKARRHSNVRLVRREAKMGLSSAVLEGAKLASGDVVVMMDADFSHDPSCLPSLVKELQTGNDVAIGSRYVHGGDVQGWSMHRRAGSLALTWFARAMFGLRVNDPLSGFVAFRREVLRDLPTRFSSRGFKLLLEVLATQPSLRVSEVPITFVDRVRGSSKLDGRELREFFTLCYRLLRWRARRAPARPQPAW